MTYKLDLASAFLKLNRAKEHVADLARRIEEVNSNSEMISVSWQYEAEESAFVVRVQSVVDIPDQWGLIVGDAVYNFRSALDHLAWQLAVRHFNGVEPTDKKIIRDIQFPVMSQLNDWNSSRFRNHFDAADWTKLKNFQPFHVRPQGLPLDALNPLEEFCGFNGVSNVDKHRFIQLTRVAPEQGHIYIPELRDFRDCRPVLSGEGVVAFHSIPEAPQPGDVILRIPVVATGPNPHADLKTRLASYVAIRKTWKLPDCLERFGEWVEGILLTF